MQSVFSDEGKSRTALRTELFTSCFHSLFLVLLSDERTPLTTIFLYIKRPVQLMKKKSKSTKILYSQENAKVPNPMAQSKAQTNG